MESSIILWRVFIVCIIVFFFIVIIYAGVAGKKETRPNPWNEYADTLEWTLPSPPPEHTFEILPKQGDGINPLHISSDQILRPPKSWGPYFYIFTTYR